MKIRNSLIGILILAFALSGCAQKAPIQSVELPAAANGLAQRDMALPEVASAPLAEGYSADSSKTGSVNAAEPAYEQMVIMNANLSIAVDDPTQTLADIQKMAKEMGGFTVSSNLYKTQTANGLEVPQANLTIRVPAERLDEALKEIKDMTGDAEKYTLNENISGQDITQEYTDLQSRLRNLEEADAKLSEFYEQATKTEDALAIYNQKMQVTEQIEVLKGQIKYYDQAVAKSAISVQIQSKETIAPVTIAGWQPSGVARDALQALINFGKGLVNFLIWLGILIIPILLVIGLPIFFLVRWLTRRSRRAQANRAQMAAAARHQEPPSTSKPPLPPM